MSESILEQVKRQYATAARSGLSGERDAVSRVARAFGYTPEELASLPAQANLGLSCGNPVAAASLRQGETVVDLGCGGGLDVFLAADRVGPQGKVIGIDMTAEMIELARANASRPVQGHLRTNVEFHLAAIDRMPLADGLADCVISNCVLNLVPDKQAAFREIFRILKPGGRLAVSDIALKQPLPEEIASDMAAYVGCIAGAIAVDQYESLLRQAGFRDVQVLDTKKDLNAYAMIEGQSGCCSPAAPPSASSGSLPIASCQPAIPAGEASIHQGLAELLRKYDVNEYAASVQVYALKGSG